jgi:pilus assembly protein Flp/PilA
MAGLKDRCESKGDGVVSSLLKRFQEDVAGATAIEYALIAGLISISIITAATSIGTRLSDIFTAVNDGFPDADS